MTDLLVRAPSTPLTLVSAVRVRAGAEADHRRLHDEAVAEALALGGLVRAELVPAIPGLQPDTVALLTFDSRTALDRWLDADVRHRALGQMSLHVDGDRTTTVVHDFAGWFGTSQPVRWKQALVVVMGLVPIALAANALRRLLLPDLPEVLAVALVSAVNVAALTWLVMPLLTRLLATWLAPPPRTPVPRSIP